MCALSLKQYFFASTKHIPVEDQIYQKLTDAKYFTCNSTYLRFRRIVYFDNMRLVALTSIMILHSDTCVSKPEAE